MKPSAWLIVLAVPASLLWALWQGSVDIPARDLLSALGGGGDEVTREIVWGLRAPRALSAFVCGALLALAGALLQVLLRNPLADPFILGVSGGASVGALAAMLAGAALALQHLFALAGAALAAAAIFAFSLRPSGWNAYRVVLAGAALSAGFGAIVSLLLTLAPAAQVQGMLFWLLGDLSGAKDPLAAWVVLALAALAAQTQAASLDILTLGEDKARSLGVAVTSVQTLVFVAAAAATMAAVLLGGALGFVGLVVPHLLRLVGYYGHRALLPLSVALGGSFLAAADALARSVAAPIELPAGVVTALIGVPTLLYLLLKLR
ncbi:MAG: iron ABC transporter permease [Betaproteobacteria bacterium]|nr:iron ABC transporter permease [Betaproteobacteria bacterium]